MAKKRRAKVQAVQEPPAVKAVRLDLLPIDHERLERYAKKRGLNKAAFSRMIILEKLDALEQSER